MNRPFAESFLNRADHRVCNRRLRPLSLWHFLQMEVAGSPYFVGGALPGWRDLRLAVRICGTRFPQLPALGGWAQAADWLGSWGCGLELETARFRAYLEDYNALPQLWRGERPKRAPGEREPVGLPWALGIVTGICGSTGWSAETVWDMPVGQAYWYHIGFAMGKGSGVDLMSEGEMLAIERVKARRRGQG